MKKIKVLTVCAAVAAVITALLRSIQLFNLNVQGIVSPSFISWVFYGFTALSAVAFFVSVGKSDSEELEFSVNGGAVSFMLPILGFSLLLEFAATALDSLHDTKTVLYHVGAAVAGVLLLIGFAISCFKGNFPTRLYAVSSISLLVFLIVQTIAAFVQNSTSIAFTVNICSILTMCASMFFFKSLLKEILSTSSIASRTALLRSALLTAVFAFTDTVGLLVCRYGLSDILSIAPARESVTRIFTTAVIFAFALSVLLSVRKKTCVAEEIADV